MRNEVIKILRSFEVTNDRESFKILTQGFILLFLCLSLSVSVFLINPLLSLIFALPTGIFLCRFFVFQHDCGHYSFFTSKKTNDTIGLILGIFTMIPNRLWRHIHDTHHGLVGNLDERNKNPELWTLTVNEYRKKNSLTKVLYWTARSPFFRLFVTPALWMIAPRFPIPHLGIKINYSILAHNLFYACLIYIIHLNYWWLGFIYIYLLPVYIFNFTASIMFYLQHQYEDTSWNKKEDWNLYNASINGSSYLKTSPFMAWVSGNVGCHHIHHLNTRIPSYNLQNATDKANNILKITPIYLSSLYHNLKCILWDEQQFKLISFKEYRQKQ